MGLDGGGYPGYPPRPGLDGGWGTPPTPTPIRQSSLASTCYPAGGMRLAFTQEDFLISHVLTKTGKLLRWNISLKVVQCAIDLNIFDLVSELEGSCTAQSLAEKNGYNSDATERLLNGLTSLKLTEKITEGETGQQC